MQLLAPGPIARAASNDASTLPSGRGLAQASGTAGGAAPSLDPFSGAASFEVPLRAPVGNSVSEFSVQMAAAAFDLGTQWLPGTELRFGIDRGLGEFDVDAGTAPPGDDTFDDGGLHLDFIADTLDRSSFPTSGLFADASWRRRMTELGADRDYETA